MATNRVIPLVALLCLAVAACSDDGGGTPSTSSPAAQAGLGGPAASAAAPPVVRDVDEVFFQTPSKNIICDLSPSAVRCDIIHKSWTPPPKPSSCDLDWGGMHIAAGKAGFTCAGDSLIGSGTESSATETLAYGQAFRSGSVRCTSESSGLTCLDEKTGRGFTLSAERYVLF
jgi:hypothetical protein